MSRRVKPLSGFVAPDLFVSMAREKEIVQQIQAEVKAIIQDCYPDVDALIARIEEKGLPVLASLPELQAKFALTLIGEQPGFIPPEAYKYEEFIHSMTRHARNKAHQDYSRGVIIALKDCRHFAFLTYHFYHWMAYRAGLEGYDVRGRKLFDTFNRKYQGQLHPKFLEKLDYTQTYLLKMAVRRDKEAMQFVRHVLHEVFIPKNNAKLLESGEAQA